MVATDLRTWYDYGVATIRAVVLAQPDNRTQDGRIDQSYEAAKYLMATATDECADAFYRGTLAGAAELDAGDRVPEGHEPRDKVADVHVGDLIRAGGPEEWAGLWRVVGVSRHYVGAQRVHADLSDDFTAAASVSVRDIRAAYRPTEGS